LISSVLVVNENPHHLTESKKRALAENNFENKPTPDNREMKPWRKPKAKKGLEKKETELNDLLAAVPHLTHPMSNQP
jgi:hypothetical protein